MMDGGTVWNTNLDSAVERCKEIVGEDESAITIDIIVCGSNKIDRINETSNTFGNYMRYRDIKYFNNYMRDIFEFMQAYPKVNFRYFVQPSKSLLPNPLEALSFGPEVLGPMIETGKADAEAIVKLGAGQSFAKFNEWYGSKTLRQQYPAFNEYLHR
jgi:hypothetical protein